MASSTEASMGDCANRCGDDINCVHFSYATDGSETYHTYRGDGNIGYTDPAVDSANT